MDLRYHGRILKRWRIVIAVGLVAGAMLAVLATFKVSPGGFEWRSDATFTSYSRIWVTQPGFPVGRATLPGADPAEPVGPSSAETFAPSQRFSELAVFYSYLAQSDQVRKLISSDPIEDQIVVASVGDPFGGNPLPLLEITATANTARVAQALNSKTIRALTQYLSHRVELNRVPTGQRVEIQVLNPPKAGVLTGGRAITGSVMLFLLALVATLVAVYVLENLYPSGGAARRDGDSELIDIGELFHGANADELDGPSPEEGVRERSPQRGMRARRRNRVA